MKDRFPELLKASGEPKGMDYVELEDQSIEDDPIEAMFTTVEATRADLKSLEEIVILIAEKHREALSSFNEAEQKKFQGTIDQLMSDTSRTANRVRKVLKVGKHLLIVGRWGWE